MKLSLDIQNACRARAPAPEKFRRWARAALAGRRDTAELSIRIVDEKESAALNRRFRRKKGSTNVLSFPCDADVVTGSSILGDLVICAAVVADEASEQNKHADAHWAHMVVHGTLHLLGYDHVKEIDAVCMEAIEIEILARLGYPDPYQNPEGKAA